MVASDRRGRATTHTEAACAARRAERFRTALARWRGPRARRCAGTGFVSGTIARLEGLWPAAVRHRADTGLTAGVPSHPPPELRSLVAAITAA